MPLLRSEAAMNGRAPGRREWRGVVHQVWLVTKSDWIPMCDLDQEFPVDGYQTSQPLTCIRCIAEEQRIKEGR